MAVAEHPGPAQECRGPLGLDPDVGGLIHSLFPGDSPQEGSSEPPVPALLSFRASGPHPCGRPPVLRPCRELEVVLHFSMALFAKGKIKGLVGT